MPPQASRFAITRMRSRLAPGKSCQKPHRGSHVPVHALAVANTDCGSDVGALEFLFVQGSTIGFCVSIGATT